MSTLAMGMQSLREIDTKIKGAQANEEWERLHCAYLDSDRSATIQNLKELGQGIEGNPRPLQTQLLRRVIDRRAGLYHNTPSRFLLNAQGERLDDDSSEQLAMDAAFRKAQYNLFWREVDSMLALMNNCVIRFYPSGPEGTVVPRLFAPYTVMREVDPTVPNSLESDSRFALKLGAGAFEYFERTEDGWVVALCDEDGALLDGEVPQILPYELPAMILYDRYPGGMAWLPPSMSRAAWVDATNALLNDLWALVRAEAHTLKTVATDNTANVPKESGPGSIWVLPTDAVADVLSNDPKLQEANDTLENMIRLWSISEDLPASEFDKSKQIVTGAARKIEEGPLRARREARRQLAERDERLAYRKFAAVHNAHRGPTWPPVLAGSLELDLELVPMYAALDTKEGQEASARGMQLGTRSTIDAVRDDHGNVGRAEAIRIYKRVQTDMEAYPPPEAPPQPDGPNPPKPPNPEDSDMVQGPDNMTESE